MLLTHPPCWTATHGSTAAPCISFPPVPCRQSTAPHATACLLPLANWAPSWAPLASVRPVGSSRGGGELHLPWAKRQKRRRRQRHAGKPPMA